jgi:hypothetical protein
MRTLGRSSQNRTWPKFGGIRNLDGAEVQGHPKALCPGLEGEPVALQGLPGKALAAPWTGNNMLRVGVASPVVVKVYDEAESSVATHLRPESVAALGTRIQHAGSVARRLRLVMAKKMHFVGAATPYCTRTS